MDLFSDAVPATWIVLDLETTGLNPGPDRIIEIAAVRFSGGRELEHFTTLVDPGMMLASIITQVTGLTDEDLKGKPAIEQVLPEFLAFAKRDPLIAHNAGFDLGFIQYEIIRQGLRASMNRIVDTLEIARSVLPQLPNHKLQTLLAHYGIDPGRAHRALDDARATWELFERMRKDAGDLTTWAVFDRRQAATQAPHSLRPGADATTGTLASLARTIQAAIDRGSRLRVHYDDSGPDEGEQLLAPLGIFSLYGTPRLIARTAEGNEERQLRLDRIEIVGYEQPAP
ncbi:MAG: 3'-5' exoribonuclease [Myxococcales bacterium]|nr:3'-5' exoribonuclease [Myxococcales bacterium]